MNYNNIYNQLIKKRRKEPINSNCVYHHIIPKSEGGEDQPRKSEYNHEGTNIIGLTLREHIIAHMLLARIYNDNKMWYALRMMLTINGYKTNSRIAAKARREFVERRKGQPSPTAGKKLSEEARRKISEANRRRILSDATKEKIRQSHLGKKASEETRRKMSESHRNRPPLTPEKKAQKLEKYRASLKRRKELGLYNRNKGKPFSKEVRAKLREAGRKRAKAVKQIDIDTHEVLNVFYSQQEAARALNVHQAGICLCIKGKLKKYAGYLWERA